MGYELQNADTVRKNIHEDKRVGFWGLFKKIALPILGGGPGHMKPGQFTENSEMCLSLARSLVSKQKYDTIDVACAYAYWLQTGPLTKKTTIKLALSGSMKTVTENPLNPNWRLDLNEDQKLEIFNKIRSNTKSFNENNLSNGALMRITPLAIAYRNSTYKELRKLAIEDAQITHSNPIAWDASVVYIIALVALLRGKTRDDAFYDALSYAETDIVREHMEDAKNRAIPVKLPQNIISKQTVVDPNNCILEFTNGDDYAMGYMGIALQSAFYELLHAKSFASGLEDVISRGGDTDTNGCIVAALLGAYFGIDTIPQEWVNTVRSADPYLGCRDKERYKIPMDFLSIKDIETLVPRLTNIKMS
uniref:ADP-ribosylhydrolase ARH3 n=1 Tax=Acrobeloides nanus TaxID=290746 RepID=A0A914DR44_9BILA